MDFSVIKALLPAFAAGFAVQRVIEIADPFLDEFLKEKKRLYLGFVSLAMGFVLVALGGLRVLTHLGATGLGIEVVDFIVTAFIISAGTEGFNSILKFLSYKKEEKKAESVQEKIEMRKSLQFTNAALMLTDPADLTLATPQDVMKAALQARVRQFKNNPNLKLDFKNGKFNQHMVNDDDARQVTVDATESAAVSFQRILNGDGRTIVRQGITVGIKYGDAVDVMEEALTNGSDVA